MFTNYVQLFLMTLLLFVYMNNFSEAINCRNFSVQSAQFAAENFHQIPIEGKGKDKIVQNFVESIKQKISESKKVAIDQPKKLEVIIGDPDTIVNNARKMITLATDACYRLKSKNSNAVYLNCVQYLLYHHIQKLVWRLENKFGVNFGENEEKNSFLKTYTDKKMLAWEQMVEEYGDKMAEPSMRVRIQVLVNTAGTKCQKLIKKQYKFVNSKNKQKVEEIKLQQENNTNQKDKKKKGIANKKEQNLSEQEKMDTMTENFTKRLDELNTDFATCIYHYMYAFSQNLIKKIEDVNGENSYNKELKDIYENLRQKTRNRIGSDLDKWLNGEKVGPSASTATNGGEEEDENEEETLEDPFNNCANVVKDHVEADTLMNRGDGALMDKSFDDHLFQCAGQFFEAVRGDQFDYKLFVNQYSMQLDTAMKFPSSMNGIQLNNGQNTKDQCLIMRELLLSLNQNLAHRLNYEKITSREEKEKLVSLKEQYGKLRLDKMDNKWLLQRIGKKIGQGYEKWRLTNTLGTLTHPIRDQYRIGRELVEQMLEDYGISDTYKKGQEAVVQTINKLCESLGIPKKEKKKIDRKEADPGMDLENDKKEKVRKTLKECIEEDKNKDECDQKIMEMQIKIQEYPLTKRLEAYKMFFRAFYIALAMELFERMSNQAKENWHFVFRSNETEQVGILTEKDRANVAKIKDQRGVFDQIVTRMGKPVEKEMGATFIFKFWEKTSKEKQHGGNESPVNEADKEIGIGHELRFMGYVMESNGEELLETLKDEMQLNLEQFNMSFDGQCDLTSDLTDCFAASDGLDYDAQLEKLSFTGKDNLGTIEKAAELLFKKLNRWSYKFGQKEKHQQNFMQRFFTRNLKGIFGLIPKLMTRQESPFELIVPFYRPVKKGTKTVINKVIVEPNRKLRAWLLKTFKKVVEPIKELFIKVALTKWLKRSNGNGEKKEQRRRKRGIGQGAGLTAYEAAGKPGSATIEAMLIDFKLTETSLTTPLPGVQLHWIHFNHAVMLGKYNLAMSFVTCIIMLFTIVSFLYWWYALMLSVRMASNYGEFLGWVTVSMALAFYILFFLAFVLL
ncbi:hypothetical protein niasHT_027128 [Heterodera trifolii]|uniref:Transmembrane protein n=1 Tax=Heterodera trifolii TaxID=157864 RepID=A0ABD2KAU4_9BILA